MLPRAVLFYTSLVWMYVLGGCVHALGHARVMVLRAPTLFSQIGLASFHPAGFVCAPLVFLISLMKWFVLELEPKSLGLV